VAGTYAITVPDAQAVLQFSSVGYVNKNYLKIKDVRSVHYIVFSRLFNDESVLNDLNIIMISLREWFDLIIRRSKNEDINRLRQLSNLKIKVIGEEWPR